ncbi:two-component sensor histidine kinase [Sphaerisporangium siamense]|uniref:Oxygen sensor histidine kinase NreB n=1 Tax=Sphaerisporangium siamense TaxID=795645 RepID=A0A7W7G9S7_9ACTN|nr:sensor histidine kinase [Sphaerisporangium siamense]MBB4700945.1 signal transduction histidine kinase [Sphaerisporangium siamense]GII85909.1 two-component sensor histidine kinase [Sphaerisporangium siamense]
MSDHPFSPALRLLRWTVHGTFAILLVIALAGVAGQGRLALVLGGTLLGLLYAAGVAIEGRLPHFGGPTHLLLGRAWLVMTTLGWAALALAAPQFVWLAFPLFFAYLHLLPLAVALPGVAVLTVAAVLAGAWHEGRVTAAQVIGPTIGAAVATLMAMVYKALYTESEQRRLLIDDLVHTREKLLRAESDAARLAERERLAREIHDTLAQGMSSIILLLRAARRDLGDDLSMAERRIAEAQDAAKENLEEARNFVRALAPPVLQHSSLVAALRRVSDSAVAGTAIQARFEISGTPVPLPEDYDAALLRIAQGALGNVSRHSAAEHAGVTLTYLDDVVMLDVYDDGRGFAPDGSAGFGLRAMHERVSALGGSLTVESAPGEGTAVVATLPLPPGEAP